MNIVMPARSALKAVLGACAAGAVAAALLVGADPAPAPVGAQTNGQIIPCPGSPYGNGWFNTYGSGRHGSVNCSQQNNHIVVDIYNSQGIRTQAGIDLWFGSQCDWVSFIEPNPGYPFVIRMRNNQYNILGESGCGTHGVPINMDGATWTSTYRFASDTRANQCHVSANRTCTILEGFEDLRTRGINNGPFVMYGVDGVGNGARQSTFVTDLKVLLQS